MYARHTLGATYNKPLNVWWDGYQPGESVILDDVGLEHSWLGYHLKVWADRYSFEASVKGSSMAVRPPMVVVTSNYKIE